MFREIKDRGAHISLQCRLLTYPTVVSRSKSTISPSIDFVCKIEMAPVSGLAGSGVFAVYVIFRLPSLAFGFRFILKQREISTSAFRIREAYETN